ncbi:MAG: ester cyclase [Kofleriaceae bacterium]|nr:ester cyclase [Kofleriaceae bacterium]
MSELDIPCTLLGRWHELAPLIRRLVATFLPPRVRADPRAVPEPFAADVEEGAPRLRAAFPHLERSLVAVELGDEITIRIATRATHEATFYGFLQATGRAVQFDEVHALSLEHGQVTAHRVAIDMRSIVRQLGARP